MNKQQQELFTNFRKELTAIILPILNGVSGIPDGDIFETTINSLIKDKYSEIFFEAQQFGADMVNAIYTTGIMVQKEDLAISPKEVIKEVLTEPFYIDGKLTPVTQIAKALIFKDFSEKHKIPEEFLAVLFEEDKMIDGLIKETIVKKKIAAEKSFTVTYFPTVKQNSKSATFH